MKEKNLIETAKMQGNMMVREGCLHVLHDADEMISFPLHLTIPFAFKRAL